MKDLRRLAEAATEGPWEAYVTRLDGVCGIEDGAGGWVAGCLEGDFDMTEEDATFIAACDPQTILALLDDLDAARKVVSFLSSMVRSGEKHSARSLAVVSRVLGTPNAK